MFVITCLLPVIDLRDLILVVILFYSREIILYVEDGSRVTVSTVGVHIVLSLSLRHILDCTILLHVL
jgi:hypothetical protein